MFGFLRKKRNEKAAQELLLRTVNLLQHDLPELYAKEKRWLVHSIHFQPTSIFFLHTTNDKQYLNKSDVASAENCYRVKGLQIYDKQAAVYVKFEIFIALNLVQNIFLSTNKLNNNYDVDKITLDAFSIENVAP